MRIDTTPFRIVSLYLWRPFPGNVWSLYVLFRSWGRTRRRAVIDAVSSAWSAARRWHSVMRESGVSP